MAEVGQAYSRPTGGAVENDACGTWQSPPVGAVCGKERPSQRADRTPGLG
jgi:hypothetical protein